MPDIPNERLEYVARAAILSGYAFRDGDLTKDEFTADLRRLQLLLDPERVEQFANIELATRITPTDRDPRDRL